MLYIELGEEIGFFFFLVLLHGVELRIIVR